MRMDDPRLDSLDVRALRALHVLLETRSVTATARRLHTSQPTMSRILGELRSTLGDPLVIQTGRRLEPTPHAVALASRVAAAVAAVQSLVLPVEPAAREWHIAATDYAFSAVVRPWLAQAPSTRVHVHGIGAETLGALERGDVHLAIAPRVDVRGADGLVLKPLLQDHHVVVMRQGHPLARRKLTVDGYLAARHVAVSTAASGRSLVEVALRRLGYARDVAYRVSSLSQAIALVATTDAIATLPARCVDDDRAPIVARPPPFDVDPLELRLAFVPRHAADPAHRALREALSVVGGSGR
jgi:DNA-binding transcriptional LysR family regulator